MQFGMRLNSTEAAPIPMHLLVVLNKIEMLRSSYHYTKTVTQRVLLLPSLFNLYSPRTFGTHIEFVFISVLLLLIHDVAMLLIWQIFIKQNTCVHPQNPEEK